MAHDVFISHSTKDKSVSDAVCAALENAGIRCWIAPRDVRPGRSFAGEITRGIQQSKAMVLVFSTHSNNSEQVLREVQLAVAAHLHIVQFRIEEVVLNDDLQYFLGTPHWLDALTPPLENHIGRLESSIKALLDAPAELPTKGDVTPPSFFLRSNAEVSNEPIAKEQEPKQVAPSPSKIWRPLVIAAIVICTGAVAGWWFGVYEPARRAHPLESAQNKSEPTQLPSVAPTPTSSRQSTVAEVDAANLSTQPANGETIGNALPLIKANLTAFGQIDPGTVQMRLSGLGIVDASFDPKTQTIAYQVPQKLRGGKDYIVIVEAKSGGKKVEMHWTFRIEEAANNPER